MSTQPKIDVYDIVTNRIIELLEAGTVPWQQPWAEAGIPRNLISKRPYRGINVWLLSSLNFAQNLFLTWDQLKKIGGSVKPGEQGHIVVFWKSVKRNNNPEEEGEERIKTKVLLRYYKVWNISQCRDIPPQILPETAQIESEYNPILECEAVINLMPECPVIQHEGVDAYYHIEGDYINMPDRKFFKTVEGYYQTLFHEIVHWTGHKNRLNRKSVANMAEVTGEILSLEELIAEIGACYLSSSTGILQKVESNGAAYIQCWLRTFKNDKKFIVHAASFAQKAVDFILNRKDEEEKGEVEQSEMLEEN